MSLKFANTVILVISVALSFVTTESYAVIDTDQYQVPMAPAPVSVTGAIDTLPDRKATVISVVACGSELRFLPRHKKNENSEDISATILGKIVYAQRHDPQFGLVSIPCQATVTALTEEICELFDDDCHIAWNALTNWPGGDVYTPDVQPLLTQIKKFLPSECQNNNSYSIKTSTPSTQPPALVRLTFTITPLCLRAQVHKALGNMSRGEKQVGTDGAPCFIFGGTTGDWDATLKDLIRIAELDRKQPVLDSAIRAKLNDELIDIDGGPAQEGYHLWECGNEEKSVGNPQTRSDERDGFDSFLDDLGDTLEDLFWIVLLIVLFLTIVAPVIAAIVTGSGLLAALGVTAAVAIAVVTVAAVLVTIPETENHLWMINSTKYLNNQYIIAKGGTGYWNDQNKLREWILTEMRRTLKEDFLEYNSRPYQRYSLVAITNLADFAKDEDIRTGARLVLEYAVAKYSVASNEGRRIAPYRRKRESLQFVDGIPRDGTALTRPTKDLPKNGLFDLSQGADYLHVVGLLYYGFSLNLLEYTPHQYAATISYASNAIYFATSDYLPDKTTYSLALDRTNSPLVHQQLHHGGWEIVSSGRSFTITAGGLTTGMPKNTSVDAIDGLIVPDDYGVAVPTIVMLAGPPHLPPTFQKPEVWRSMDTRRSTFDRFLRFEGKRPEVVDSSPSYDSNMCVWDGFACGVNLVIPSDLREPCMKPGPRSYWFFIRSDDAECPAYKNGPRFSMVVYNQPTSTSDVDDFGPIYSMGFIEIVDGDEMTFDEFKARILQRNPGPNTPIDTSDDCKGTFVSARGSSGQRIEFDCKRVTKVDAIEQLDPTDWEHAGAPPGALGYAPMQSSGTGKVELTSRIAKRKVILNFEQTENPLFDTVTLP